MKTPHTHTKSNLNTPRHELDPIKQNDEIILEEDIIDIPEDDEKEEDEDESVMNQLKNLKNQRPMTADMLHKYKIRPFSSKVKGPIINPNPSIPQKVKDFALPKSSASRERNSKIEEMRPKSAVTKFESFQPTERDVVRVVKSQQQFPKQSNSIFKSSLIEYAMVRNPNISLNNLNAGTFLRNNIELVSNKFYRSLFSFNSQVTCLSQTFTRQKNLQKSFQMQWQTKC